MCLLAILHQVVDGCPIFVAANREEFYSRRGTAPELWPGWPRIMAGRDPQAGGTWLGVNEHGLLVAVTNRPKPGVVPARSRGLLCRDLLGCRSTESARQLAVQELTDRPYAGCNIALMDAVGACVIHAGQKIDLLELDGGIYVLSKSDVNDRGDDRVVRALDWFTSYGMQRSAGQSEQPAGKHGDYDYWYRVGTEICGDHGSSGGPPICLHWSDRGTVSSSIIGLSPGGGVLRWHHAQGPPCRTEYADYSHLLRRIVQNR